MNISIPQLTLFIVPLTLVLTIKSTLQAQLSNIMKFNARGGISILELLVYFPFLVIAAIVCRRHGFGRSSGWIFTLILCLVRIIGSCCQLATYSDQSSGLLEATIILDSIGLSPLLFATLGMLSRW